MVSERGPSSPVPLEPKAPFFPNKIAAFGSKISIPTYDNRNFITAQASTVAEGAHLSGLSCGHSLSCRSETTATKGCETEMCPLHRVAEFVADIFLCPFEAVRIRAVSDPTYGGGGMVSTGKKMRNSPSRMGSLQMGIDLNHCRRVLTWSPRWAW